MSTTRGQHLLGKEVGDCLLEKLIGYGGTSAVFLAQPRNSEQKVAVKVFLPRSTLDSHAQKGFYRRFLREAQAASELDHPHILSVYSYGEHQGLPYIIMPYLPGGALADYVKKEGPLTLRVAQDYLKQIAEALDYAHECSCVHCDVKPANILLGGGGQVVLSDFGIVRLLQGTSLTAQQSVKSPETLMGTPDYISPEQALGEPLDGRSDIYSLAVTLFFLLTGEPPFKSDSTIAMALMHVHEKPPLLGLQRADVTPEIDEVIGVALAKWPEERYQSAKAFSDAFSVAVSHADNIDRVALVNRAPRKLIGRAREDSDVASLAAEVRVRSLVTKRPALRSRPILFTLAISILLIAAVTVGFILNSTLNLHFNGTGTPVTPNDALVGNQSAWPTSTTF
ncbi:MAG TPA: serine/threonine-protein kinase, partial [Ktedonobacteraceae bacterium]|nr:serine/threonine-protein kinase [Ktedonobacteraceae bacterium]